MLRPAAFIMMRLMRIVFTLISLAAYVRFQSEAFKYGGSFSCLIFRRGEQAGQLVLHAPPLVLSPRDRVVWKYVHRGYPLQL